MATQDELEHFFEEPARLQIENDFDSECVLCKQPLKAGEGHFVPLLNNSTTYTICLNGLYTLPCMPDDAANGLYACQPCARKWLMNTHRVTSLAALMPCKPLMLYAMHALRLAKDKDEASRTQTLDAILDDLQRDRISTDERQRAASFLHCYQLCPVKGPSASSAPSLDCTLHVWPSPSTYLTHDDRGWPGAERSNVTRYCILERDGEPVSRDKREVPLYGKCKDGAITLWRIPQRAPGLFLGHADFTRVMKSADPALHDVYRRLCTDFRYHRGLPLTYRMKGVTLPYDAFENIESRLVAMSSPTSSDSSGAPDQDASMTSHITLTHRESSSESDSSVDKTLHGLGVLLSPDPKDGRASAMD